MGLKWKKLEKRGLITLIQQPIEGKKLMSIATPIALIQSKKVKRVVLDSITLFEYLHVMGEMDYRKEVLDFVLKMKESNVTLLATAEKSISNIDEIEYNPEDFLFEGLILLTKIRKGHTFEHCIQVYKMRGQNHSVDIFPMKIGKNGVEVFPDQIPFSLEQGGTFK